MPRTKSYNTYDKLLNVEFRKRVDALLIKFEQDFYRDIVSADEMKDASSFDMGVYKRHNVETILRIGLKRAVDPLVANHWATRDPQLSKEWGLYGAEEGRHDRMFARDLFEVGMTEEEIYSTPPTFATELLNGYFYYTMATEGPLASMVSGFYLEYMAGKTQPDWLDAMEVHLGAGKTKGARAHLALDIEEDHVNMVWNMIMRVIKTPHDEEKFVEHLTKINALFVAYFVETVQSRRRSSEKKSEVELLAAPASALKVAATALA